VDAAGDPRLTRWLADLEARCLADLTFQEVSRALRALSSAYVERRSKLASGAALAGAGKRAAFALFYGPLHFLLVRHIVESMGALAIRGPLLDLGCGTGAGGAAWASACSKAPEVVGVDRHPWAVDESRRTYRMFDLRARTSIGTVDTVTLPAPASVLLAFTVNELNVDSRVRLLPRLLAHAERGGAVLVVEPIAGFVSPWWNEWADAFKSVGGRCDEWRVRTPLPAIVQKLDRAAGLNHREITGRSLSLGT
jgi:SAM-dependent methyltransferase